MKKVILIYFFLISTCLFAQNSHQLSGRIVDDAGEGIAYAVISVLTDNGTMVTQTSTDLDGFFTAKGTENTVHLVVLASGFEPYQGSPFVWNKTLSLPTIILQASVNQLEEITVSATRNEPAIRLEAGKIIFSPAQSAIISGGNAFDALKKTPGILIDNANNFSILGKKGAMVFINGKSTYMQGDDLANFLKSLTVSQVKNIEVMMNPSAQFDAEGGAGIINIVLNKKHIEGTFLSVGSGVSYWEHLRNNTDISLQHNIGKVNINAGYNHQVGNVGIYYGSTRYQNDNELVSTSDDTDRRKFVSGNIGVNFLPNEKNTLGLNLTANTAFGKGEIYTQNDIFDTNHQLQRTLFAISDYFSQKANRYGVNAFYEYQPSDNQKYNIDVDYVFFDGGTGNLQSNAHQLPNANRIDDDTYLTDNTRKIHIFATAFHQKLKLGKGDWASGVKFSQVSSDNNFTFYTLAQPQNILDVNRSNRFDYQEKIIALYAQYRYPITEKLTAEAGLRSEHTFPLGKLFPYAGSSEKYQENGNNYSNLFPSLNVVYQQDDRISYGLNYSSRISRPVYQELNPFSYPLDGLSSWKGNPFLLPQKIQKISANITKNSTNLIVSYTFTKDFSAQITEKSETNKVLMTPKNIGNQKYFSASLFQEINIGNWYKLRFNPTIFYIKNDISLEKYPHFALKRWSFSFNSQHEFQLPFRIKGSVNTDYYSKRINAANEIAKTSGFIDVGLQRSFWEDKLNVNLSFTDILHTNRWDNESHLPDLANYGWGYFESRQIKFYITYKIGKQKSQSTHQSDLNETERL